ncbi:RCC1 domain-containing protein [Thermomonospora echinospora]|nr:RCC1 domain-containing protein [Thermomonospora echinospora]
MHRRRTLPAALPPALAALCLLSGCSDAGPAAGDKPRVVSPPPAGTAGKVSGEVWTAGYNTDGQLGRRTAKDMDVALGPAMGLQGQGRLRGVLAMAGGGRHSLAILADHRVVAWGANDKSQLGDGTKTARAFPTPVRAPDGKPGNLSDVAAVAADADFSMALLGNGTVVTWGTGESGQRGIGRKAAPAFPTTLRRPDGRGPLTGVTAIAVNGRTGLALTKSGTVFGWGANRYGMVGDGTATDRPLPRPVRGPNGAPKLTGVRQISLGGRHALARLANGTVVAWGANNAGQLGDGTRRNHAAPTTVAGPHGLPILRNVTSVSAGANHNYALRGDGTVVAWGENVSGQLGNGSVEDSLRPVPVLGVRSSHLRGVAQIHASGTYGVAVLTDGTALTWGSGGKGQLGSGNLMPRSRPGTVVLTGGRPAGRVIGVGTGQRHLQLLMRW